MGESVVVIAYERELGHRCSGCNPSIVFSQTNSGLAGAALHESGATGVSLMQAQQTDQPGEFAFDLHGMITAFEHFCERNDRRKEPGTAGQRDKKVPGRAAPAISDFVEVGDQE